MKTTIASLASDLGVHPEIKTRYDWIQQCRYVEGSSVYAADKTYLGADTGTKTTSDRAFGMSDDEDSD